MEYELLIREAESKDAAELVSFLNCVSLETDFTSLDGEGILLTDTDMELFLDKQTHSENQITLLALLNDKIAGIVNITADQRKRVRHIGDLFIVIGKKYWNNGLGSLLIEEAIEWAQASGILRRLQLTVQTRNQAAGKRIIHRIANEIKEDISGDYNDFRVTANEKVNGTKVIFKGGNKMVYLIGWTKDGQTHGMYFERPVTRDMAKAIVVNTVAPKQHTK